MVTVGAQAKVNQGTVTLTVLNPDSGTPAGSTDNSTGNKMSFCLGGPTACLTPTSTAEILLARTAGVCTPSGQPSPGWSALENFSTTKVGYCLDTTNETTPQVVNIAVVDSVGNVAPPRSSSLIYDHTPPPQPQNVVAQDQSNATQPFVFVHWQALSPTAVGMTDASGGSDFASFIVSRATGDSPLPGSFTQIGSLSDPTATSFPDSNVAVGTKYSYRIWTVDNLGNASQPVQTTPPVAPRLTGTASPPTPVILNVRQTVLGTQSVKIEWNTVDPNTAAPYATDAQVVYARIGAAPTVTPPGGVSPFDGYPVQSDSSSAGTPTPSSDAHSLTLFFPEFNLIFRNFN